ncbi:40S ribosomal protein S6 [Durusdinium trenchii]|uniref:40S ribosomal protein S6 n=1 Tax=Durusdinium trenchii TaxID=1381693 RepID=A0ABP0RFA4_9DINO
MDDVRQFVVRREVKEGKKSKAPKIQRLITPQLLQRKRYFKALTRKRMEAGKEAKAAYQKRLSEYHHEQKEKRAAELQKKKAPCWADTADTTHFSSRMWQKRQKTCYSYVMLRVELNGFSFPRDIFP